jgi:hypothetical protein
MLKLKQTFAHFAGIMLLIGLSGIVSSAFSQEHGDGGKPATSCPAPTVAQGGQCVLLGDADLTETLRLTSGTKLNCRGHRLTPVVVGSLDDPRTVANEFKPSQPELAIFLHRTYDTTIKNCRIVGFDFGILVAETKAPEGESETGKAQNKILANTIDVLTNAVSLLKSDRVLIADNQLTYAAERGRGVAIEFDSDGNRIVNNKITSTDAASTGLVRQFPGGAVVADSQTPVMDNEVHCLAWSRPLQNVVVGGELIQFLSFDPQAQDLEDAARSDHNLIEANTITDLGVGTSCTRDPAMPCRSNADCGGKGTCLLKLDGGVAFNNRAGDNAVRANTISGRMGRGISFAGNPAAFTLANFFPGACTLDHSRLCVDNTDCNLVGFDQVGKGACAGTSPWTFNGNTVGLVAEGNTLAGAFDTAALFANNVDGFTFRGNLIEGGGATASGIALQGAALNGVVQRNVVNGTGDALFLGRPSALTWLISLNDFTGYLTAVRTANDYNLPTDLGGNYWGLPCPGFDPGLVRHVNGSVNPFVTDTHAYGVPVASAPDDQLPVPCQ